MLRGLHRDLNIVSQVDPDQMVMTSTKSPCLSYRPDIDGLRAIAIATVVIFHLFPQAMPGGFVGVDVFFVISGFLISRIIFAGLVGGTFSFKAFYISRTCRIVPPLIVVLIATVALGWFLLLPDEWRQLGRHVRGGALYFSNFVLKSEAGYFDAAAELKPLLHLWSLAIEEQFYIVWPALLAFAFRCRVWLLGVVLLALSASFVYGLFRLGYNPEATFYMADTRIWELLIGSVLAHHAQFGWKGILGRMVAWGGRVPADLRAGMGLGLIAVAVAVLSPLTRFPGWWALLPTLGAALLISAGPQTWVNRALLGSRPFIGLGRISYPLYLWHWPLLSLAIVATHGAVGLGTRLALVVTAIVLAVLTYMVVERPLRFGPLRRGPVAVVLTGLCLAMGVVGTGLHQGWVSARSSGFGLDRIVDAAGEWAYPTTDMAKESFQGRKLYSMKGRDEAVLFLGDSNAEQYWPRIQALGRQASGAGKTAYFLTSGDCLPIPGVVGNCRAAATLELVRERRIGTVVVASQWWSHFADKRYTLDGTPLSDPHTRERAVQALKAFLGQLSGEGRKVFLILSIPTGAALDPKAMISRNFGSFDIVPQGLRLGQHAAERALSAQMRQAAEEAGVEVIDPLPYLCDGDFCPAATPEGNPMYKDATHLRPSFVREHATYIDRTFVN